MQRQYNGNSARRQKRESAAMMKRAIRPQTANDAYRIWRRAQQQRLYIARLFRRDALTFSGPYCTAYVVQNADERLFERGHLGRFFFSPCLQVTLPFCKTRPTSWGLSFRKRATAPCWICFPLDSQAIRALVPAGCGPVCDTRNLLCQSSASGVTESRASLYF